MSADPEHPRTARECLAPYLAAIARAAAESGEDPYLLAGICLRESLAGWAPGYGPKGRPDGWGDKGFAFGLFQIDRRWHDAFTSSEHAADPFEQARYACILLGEARRQFKRSGGRFVSPHLVERATVAAYNAGFGAVFHAVDAGRDPDSPTTGHDYSRDVLRRAEVLRGEFPSLFAAELVS